MLVVVEKDRTIVIRNCVALQNGHDFSLDTETFIPSSFSSHFMNCQD